MWDWRTRGAHLELSHSCTEEGLVKMLMGDSDTHSSNTRVQQDRAARANAAMRHCTAMILFVTRATMRVTHEARRHVDVPSTYQSGSYRCLNLPNLFPTKISEVEVKARTLHPGPVPAQPRSSNRAAVVY